jgi:hypothetical protein
MDGAASRSLVEICAMRSFSTLLRDVVIALTVFGAAGAVVWNMPDPVGQPGAAASYAFNADRPAEAR